MRLNELVKKWRVEYPRQGSPEWEAAFDAAREQCADDLETALQQQGEAVRLWDSQWVNIVNAPEVLNAESKEEAVNAAVRLTEKAMAANVAKDTHPPKPVVSDELLARALQGWAEHQRRCRITTIEGSLRAALEAALGVKS